MFHRLKYVNAWSLVNDAIWISLEGVASPGDICHWGDFEVSKPFAMAVCSLYPACHLRGEPSTSVIPILLLAAMISHHDGLLSLWKAKSNKPFLSASCLGHVFFFNQTNRKIIIT